MEQVITSTEAALASGFAMSAYCRLLDIKKWDSWKDLMAGEATFEFLDISGNRELYFDSPSAFVAATKEYIGTAVTVHHLHNQEILQTGAGSVTVRWSMEDRICFDKGARADFTFFHGFGHYTVTFVKRNDAWLISKLVLSRLAISFR
ncbi:nuclear transport factor 2 family protein [Flavobacterium sp. MAH-1]|uniref:Nuclear transport factor 2 family protein n=1 Tax=Flavobacterium agri TaxID=2743471 RepID=A0A7Y8XZK3_9FLAO|nr:nuclear transport factor 2 family protein [Flavobacterium agri]NUY79627.1 nuclear transport factor 2 family protein [Flavobacterium agri]NYA69652.1 nuclear transport factor 2 family protein [Flavobacterium agri]